jgi:hypothetical protein
MNPIGTSKTPIASAGSGSSGVTGSSSKAKRVIGQDLTIATDECYVAGSPVEISSGITVTVEGEGSLICL